MREETQPLMICAVCKLPITQEQLPSIRMKNGDELHIECYRKREEASKRPN